MTTTTTSLQLDTRENGPRGMSNGGFACGTFAELAGGTASVTLEAKVPLGVPLTVTTSQGGAEVSARGRPLATVRETEAFVLEPPVRPTYDEAADARERHPLRGTRHPLSDCVVCGPERYDGLRVTPGPLAADGEVLAAPFQPTVGYAVAGAVRAAAVWGALDCPSYPAAALMSRRFCLLGSLEAHQVRPVAVGERLVVVGWTTGVGDRSTRTASAMIAEDGSVVASARAVWVALRHQWAVRAVSRIAG
ncbi:MAG: hypothetical protein ABWZ91_05620 [Nocardioides sp.]